MDEFFKEALEKHETLLDKMEEGLIPTQQLLEEFEKQTRYDTLKISSEYMKHAINREQIADEIFERQAGSQGSDSNR